MACEIVLQLDTARELRELKPTELQFRNALKVRCLGLASSAQTIARQRSRLLFLEAGDANTKLFHLQACHRSRKNFISELQVEGRAISEPDSMASALFDHFNEILGTEFVRPHSLNLHRLNLNAVDGEGLDHCFSEEEIWNAIKELPSEKGSGAGWFHWAVLQTWPVIKSDVVNAFSVFWSLDHRSLFLLNDALLVLLRKKNSPREVKDYRPISLVHSFSKLVTKVLAERLAPKLDALILKNQCAFIRGRSIHDCFRAVQLSCKLLYRQKTSCVLLKIDIARAFDSVAWPFLLELLEHRGFSRRWRDWMARILQTASTRILLNGRPGRRICHGRRLRQGDPLSPLLFVLVMDVLNSMISLAKREGMLTPLGHEGIRCRASFYVDDLPSRRDLLVLRAILDVFASCSGLCTNLDKCSISPICCSPEEIDTVQVAFSCQVAPFPCCYLGIPLSYKKLTRASEQGLVDKVAQRIPKWKDSLLNLAGRTVLVKSTLSAIPVHVSIAIGLSGWAIGAIDKFCRAFLWSGSDLLVRGKAKVAWPSICRPLCYGGLGMPNIALLGLALRVRWCWLQKVEPKRVWVQLPQCFDRAVRDLFRACVDIVVGNGESVLFWTDNWLEGLAKEVLAPNLFATVPARFLCRTVANGLHNRSWINDIKPPLSVDAVAEYVDIWERVQNYALSNQPDKFLWRFTTDHHYSSASTYRACFFGSTSFPGARILWKTRAPPKVKYFAWLAIQDRCWTAERYRRHGLQDTDACALCDQDIESMDDLLVGCCFTREVWFRIFAVLNWSRIVPSGQISFIDRWLQSRKDLPKSIKRGFDSLTLLVTWTVWKERNERVFRHRARMPGVVVDKIKEEALRWVLAGVSSLGDLAVFASSSAWSQANLVN
ncbi:LOW QUALITY PROTEIN: hypothetical protein U9M48_004243 [Paspalum notatum var. saurae]|uniref:Reverse transcriptase domain-containing protein n=1 Tax=Paspalum notatum var. saurae TaxID=547442 RepID=A0AAQ3PM93_PASNO